MSALVRSPALGHSCCNDSAGGEARVSRQAHEALHDGVKLGLWVSLPLLVLFVVPVGIALRSILIPVVSFLAVMLVCVLGKWLVSLGDGWKRALLVASWCLGLAVALGLLGFGIWAMNNFSPHCLSTHQFQCFDTVAEQRRKYMIDTVLFPVGGGATILLVLTGLAVKFVRDRRHLR
jgi:hypothetical protein